MNKLEKLETILEFKIEEYNKEIEEYTTIKQRYEKENKKDEAKKWEEIIDRKLNLKWGIKEALDALNLINQ